MPNQLLTDIFYHLATAHGDSGQQYALVADGAFQGHFHEIADSGGLWWAINQSMQFYRNDEAWKAGEVLEFGAPRSGCILLPDK